LAARSTITMAFQRMLRGIGIGIDELVKQVVGAGARFHGDDGLHRRQPFFGFLRIDIGHSEWCGHGGLVEKGMSSPNRLPLQSSIYNHMPGIAGRYNCIRNYYQLGGIPMAETAAGADSVPAPDLWFSFVRTHRLMIREIERRLAAADLPVYAWYDVLWGLESGPDGSRRMHELADALAIERYSLTRLVDKLETDRLVTRTRSMEDGRAAFVSITQDGKALRQKMRSVYQATVADLFLAQFGSAQQQEFSATLARAAEAARGATQSKA
jgi:DNA-binding MarR family transcriptional regulator